MTKLFHFPTLFTPLQYNQIGQISNGNDTFIMFNKLIYESKGAILPNPSNTTEVFNL